MAAILSFSILFFSLSASLSALAFALSTLAFSFSSLSFAFASAASPFSRAFASLFPFTPLGLDSGFGSAEMVQDLFFVGFEEVFLTSFMVFTRSSASSASLPLKVSPFVVILTAPLGNFMTCNFSLSHIHFALMFTNLSFLDFGSVLSN
jgi:hypothetical protein